MLRGQFRQSPTGVEPVAFVSTPTGGCFVTESIYQASGYQPPFEELPLQEEYEAATEKQDIEADEDGLPPANTQTTIPQHLVDQMENEWRQIRPTREPPRPAEPPKQR